MVHFTILVSLVHLSDGIPHWIAFTLFVRKFSFLLALNKRLKLLWSVSGFFDIRLNDHWQALAGPLCKLLLHCLSVRVIHPMADLGALVQPILVRPRVSCNHFHVMVGCLFLIPDWNYLPVAWSVIGSVVVAHFHQKSAPPELIAGSRPWLTNVLILTECTLSPIGSIFLH
jgi:hypothetical protein